MSAADEPQHSQTSELGAEMRKDLFFEAPGNYQSTKNKFYNWQTFSGFTAMRYWNATERRRYYKG